MKPQQMTAAQLKRTHLCASFEPICSSPGTPPCSSPRSPPAKTRTYSKSDLEKSNKAFLDLMLVGMEVILYNEAGKEIINALYLATNIPDREIGAVTVDMVHDAKICLATEKNGPDADIFPIGEVEGIRPCKGCERQVEIVHGSGTTKFQMPSERSCTLLSDRFAILLESIHKICGTNGNAEIGSDVSKEFSSSSHDQSGHAQKKLVTTADRLSPLWNLYLAVPHSKEVVVAMSQALVIPRSPRV